jgi:hypothetical protein
MSWTDAWGRPTGSIEVLGGEEGVTLVYAVRETDAEAWRPIETRVALTRIPKPFGGSQVFFVCPTCNRRILELAFGYERFRCRHCLGLVYRTSQQSPADRAMSRADKLRQRLGGEPGLESCYARPKHMRRKTFERIDAQIQAAETEVLDEHIRVLGRITQRSQRSRHHRAGRHADAKSGRAFW